MPPCTIRNRWLIAGIAFCLITLTAPFVLAQENRPSPTPPATQSPSPSPEPSRGPDQPPGEDEGRPRDPMSTRDFQWIALSLDRAGVHFRARHWNRGRSE